MPKRQPEGIIKDDCREIAESEDLIFWQIEGKSRNGVPDTLASTVSGRAILIEFKVPGRLPNDQQWLRIYELREAGIEAWYCTSVAMYRRLVGLDPGGYEVAYPPKVQELIRLGTKANDLNKRKRRKPAPKPNDDAYDRFFHLITEGRVKAPSRGVGQ